ncbi:FlxA-like family protein [Vallitalea pronyensis]|uniref:FlxA-like family protein n=1 Tax=Vallitalea pronyensis TaxID=1348613 RepID=A0A8J8MIR0_9FIRM|nr:FlxA-like family protein [Vallitalea pronyensis]QUI22577.1 FlxA-like family protein [Vallitalea pronyensis]
MHISMNNNTSVVGLGNDMLQKQEKQETYIGKLQKQMMGLEKQIADVRENDQLSSEEKKSRLKQLEEQKQEIMIKIQEEQIQEKMRETEKKIEEAEERAEKQKELEQTPATPLDEIKAELGIHDMPTKHMMKASKALSTAQHKLNISRQLKQEAKILEKEYETDMGRGQSVTHDDYRLQKSIKRRTKAELAEDEAYEALGKANKWVKKAIEEIEKDKKEVSDTKEDTEDKEKKADKKIEGHLLQEESLDKQNKSQPVGTYVDVRL